MKGETQALHLAKIMQNHIQTVSYELALPLVTVRRSKLKKLSVDDVLLLGLDILEFVLIGKDTICAELVLKNINGKCVIDIVKIYSKPVETYDSNKYEIVKLSFGFLSIKSLLLGNTLDTAQFNVDNVSLILGKKTLAQGSLVSIENEIAMKINKVMK